jgi:hypothetical protein
MTAEEKTKELGERLELAEAILGDLSSASWVKWLDAGDRFANPRFGDRVIAYWRRFEAVPFVPTPCADVGQEIGR